MSQNQTTPEGETPGRYLERYRGDIKSSQSDDHPRRPPEPRAPLSVRLGTRQVVLRVVVGSQREASHTGGECGRFGSHAWWRTRVGRQAFVVSTIKSRSSLSQFISSLKADER